MNDKEKENNILPNLSDEEKFIADSIFLIFEKDNASKVVEYTHVYCTEWKDPQPLGVTSIPLLLEDIKEAIAK